MVIICYGYRSLTYAHALSMAYDIVICYSHALQLLNPYVIMQIYTFKHTIIKIITAQMEIFQYLKSKQYTVHVTWAITHN